MSEVHLSDAHRDLYERTRELAAGSLRPIADEGRPGRVNRPLVRALAEHGLLARLFPKTSAIELCLIREALATTCTDAETAFAVQGLGAYPILQALGTVLPGGDAHARPVPAQRRRRCTRNGPGGDRTNAHLVAMAYHVRTAAA